MRARSLILGEDESAPAGNVVTVGEEVEEMEGEGEEDYFKFKKCQVMAIAKKVVELCEEAKQFEAEFSDCEPTSTSTSTTILQLFKLLVPRQQSQAIKTSPKRCAVFHNSCLFLAHSSVTLNPSFLSLYPSFTRLGCDALADLIDGQREEIESVVRGGMEVSECRQLVNGVAKLLGGSRLTPLASFQFILLGAALRGGDC